MSSRLTRSKSTPSIMTKLISPDIPSKAMTVGKSFLGGHEPLSLAQTGIEAKPTKTQTTAHPQIGMLLLQSDEEPLLQNSTMDYERGATGRPFTCPSESEFRPADKRPACLERGPALFLDRPELVDQLLQGGQQEPHRSEDDEEACHDRDELLRHRVTGLPGFVATSKNSGHRPHRTDDEKENVVHVLISRRSPERLCLAY